jgi:RNA polymerase sigma-70 factor (ECF subfamily)
VKHPVPQLRVVPRSPGGDASDRAPDPIPRGDLGALYERYANYVGAIALRLTGRPDEVDDLVQDVFLAAHSGLKRRETDAEVKGWLATVTVRMSQRRLRRLRLRGFFGQDDGASFDDLAAPGASPEQKALVARIYRVLEREPVAHRVAWILRRVDGHSVSEVATLCDCSPATAKRRIAAASVAIEEVMGRD